jgi:peroxisomal coenzyme A diphosphatase NUDT7
VPNRTDQIARREAWEEIGLPLDDTKIPKPFRIEPLCCLPCSHARTEVAVRPCVAFLHADDVPEKKSLLVGETMIPRLDAKEVAAVFSAPFHNFLKAQDEHGEGDLPPEGHWYDGRWGEWHGVSWRVHNFHVPVNNQRVVKPKVREGGQAALAEELEEEEREGAQRYLVWGLTGRMLVDCARIAYGEKPEFEHNHHFGDEAIIARLEAEGRLPDKKRKEVGLEALKEDVKDAKM